MLCLDKLTELIIHAKSLELLRGNANKIDNSDILKAISAELDELQEEIKPNNKAHLEDELGDILWAWLSLVENLKQEGYIDSHEAIIQRTNKKYQERILPLKGTDEDYEIWNKVKRKQKEELRKENQAK